MNGYLPAGKLAGGISMEKKIVCNCCGKEIYTKAELPTEEYLYIKKEWGYVVEEPIKDVGDIKNIKYESVNVFVLEGTESGKIIFNSIEDGGFDIGALLDVEIRDEEDDMPLEPEEPEEEPEVPEEPSNPEKPEEPSSPESSKPIEDKEDEKLPQTGSVISSTGVAILSTLMVAGGILLNKKK